MADIFIPLEDTDLFSKIILHRATDNTYKKVTVECSGFAGRFRVREFEPGLVP